MADLRDSSLMFSFGVGGFSISTDLVTGAGRLAC